MPHWAQAAANRRSALQTELRLRRVLVLAPGTLHAGASNWGSRAGVLRGTSGPSLAGGSRGVKERRSGVERDSGFTSSGGRTPPGWSYSGESPLGRRTVNERVPEGVAAGGFGGHAVGAGERRIRAGAGRDRCAGGDRRRDAPCGGGSGLRVQGRCGRQARVAVPRADRDAPSRRQNGRSALRGADLGARRRQRGDGQGGGSRARRQPEGHPVAQARGDGAPRHRGALGRDDRPAHQDRGRHRGRRAATGPVPT